MPNLNWRLEVASGRRLPPVALWPIPLNCLRSSSSSRCTSASPPELLALIVSLPLRHPFASCTKMLASCFEFPRELECELRFNFAGGAFVSSVPVAPSSPGRFNVSWVRIEYELRLLALFVLVSVRVATPGFKLVCNSFCALFVSISAEQGFAWLCLVVPSGKWLLKCRCSKWLRKLRKFLLTLWWDHSFSDCPNRSSRSRTLNLSLGLRLEVSG